MSDHDLIAEGRQKLVDLAESHLDPADRDFYFGMWAREWLPGVLDALEAAQRPPLGYAVVAKRPRRHHPETFEYTSAGSIWPELDPVVNHRGWCEDAAAADPERFGTGMEYVIVELREVSGD